MNSFNEWNEGIVTLNCTYYSKNINEKIELVTLSGFNSQDQLRIKDAQKEYFNQSVQDEANRLIDSFILRYNRSEFKIDLLNQEVQQLFDIIFTDLPSAHIIELNQWGILLNFEILEQFRYLFKRYKINGYELDYSHQNSPLSKYYNTSLSPEVLFEAIYTYYRFLEGIVKDASCVFNPTKWNRKGFELFKFLDENYSLKSGKPKYTILFHFLAGMTQKKGENIEFNFKKNGYIKFISENHFEEYDKPNPPKMNKTKYYDKNIVDMAELYKNFSAMYDANK